MLPFLVAALAGAGPPAAQTGPAPPAVAWSLSIERRTERDVYHFDSPSTFDSPTALPHVFEQRYRSSNTWLRAGARYRLFGAGAQTVVGLTPRIQTSGSDIDTFFLPSGDVATSGTDGGVSLRAFAVAERLDLAGWRGIRLGVVLEYRRTRADFLPADRVVAHTQPPSVTREFTTDQETTISQVFGSGLTADASVPLGGSWRMRAGADYLPTVRGWLDTRLPQKDPGVDIVAEALNFGARGRLEFARHWARLEAGVGVEAGGVWRYRKAAHYGERVAAIGVFVRTRGWN